MRISITTDEGDLYNLDVSSDIELENLQALLEVESGIPTSEQTLFFSGRPLTGNTATINSFGINEDDMLLVRKKPTAPPQSVAGRDLNSESETMRRQVLGDPRLMAQLRQSQPELADAAVNNPTRFRELLAQLSSMQNSAKLQQQHEAELLNADPFNVEAQRKIEEAIRQEAVLENMESAIENMPEAFGNVHMLYVETEVNGKPVKAFVDSGAQATIMSPSCAERCGIMRLLDTRFAGMARGVGTAKILGRVHSAQIKMGKDLFLQCSFTIMEGKDVDLLFGLDMLKRHKAMIDLAKDALVIEGREIRFLAEHELPKRDEDEIELDEQGNPIPPTAPPPTAGASQPSTSATGGSFPGSGQSLSAAAPTPPPNRPHAPSPGSAAAGGGTRYPEEHINSLMSMGQVSREVAVQLLDAAGGNLEVAASMMF